MRHHPGVVQLGDHRPQLLGGARDAHQRALVADALGRVEPVVVVGDDVDALAEDGVAGEVVDPLALEVGGAAVVERRLVLLTGHHGEISYGKVCGLA